MYDYQAQGASLVLPIVNKIPQILGLTRIFVQDTLSVINPGNLVFNCVVLSTLLIARIA